MHSIKKLSGAIFCMLMLTMHTACVNVSTLQTAQTLGKKNTRVVLGGGIYTSTDNADIGVNVPALEGYIQFGVLDDLDVGLKLTIIGTMAADAKYRIYSNNGLALATGLSLGYTRITANNNTATFADAMVPLYASFDIFKYLSIYISPKYLARLLVADETKLLHFAGTSGGLKVGNTFGLFVESSYMYGFDTTNLVQYNIAGFITF